MKRRFIPALFLILCLLISMAGCGTAAPAPSETASPSETAATSSSPEASETTASSSPEASPTSVFPLSAEPIKLKFVRLSWPDVRPNAGETWTWKNFAKESNIEIEWEEYPISSYAETLNLKLASNELPDAYYQMIFSNEQLIQQSQMGALIPMDDLIAENAPNITRMFADDPSIKQAVTLPDGKIYSLPYVELDKNSAMLRYYINKSWLDEAGLPVPKTIAELDAALAAFKQKDPNRYPIAMGKDQTHLFHQIFLGAYGIGSRGIQGMSQWIDQGPDGKVRLYPVDPLYKEWLTQMNQWYKAGMFHPEYFTTMDVAKWQNLGTQNQVGLYGWVSPNFIGEEAMKSFTGITQLEGPHGDKSISWIDASVRGIWSFMITNQNKYPKETMKWVDYWYGEEGYMYSAIGQEGVTYQKGASGTYEWMGDVKKSIDEKGQQLGAFQHLERWYGGFEPQNHGMKVSDENQKKLYDLKAMLTPEEAQKTYLIDPNDYMNFLPEAIWPSFIPTAEEATEVGELFTELNTYLLEMETMFIIGKKDLGADWDAYLATVEKMGGKRYLELKQQAYDRIMK